MMLLMKYVKEFTGQVSGGRRNTEADAIDDSIEYFFEVNDDEYNLREDETVY